MSGRLVTIVLALGLVFSTLAALPRLASQRWPGDQQGYEPAQPIAFSHMQHAGELQISCLYCHAGAESSRHAGIPAASLCLNCHRAVRAPLAAVRAEEALAKEEKRPARPIVSPELEKLYEALALDPVTLKPVPGKTPRPIAWVRVHNLPAHAYFDHRAHVAAGITCQTCHGPVESMQRVRQVENLSMGWCINCHRDSGPLSLKSRAPTDCGICHR
jgi:hypothetical protein